MNSLIFQSAARLIMPVMLLFSVVILLRGHNVPGGGFVGGLMVASSLCLYGMAYGPEQLKRLIPINLHTMIGLGLLLAFLSGLPSMFAGGPFMQGLWTSFIVPQLDNAEIKIGTPVFFDLGVYAVVIGVVTLMFVSLAER